MHSTRASWRNQASNGQIGFRPKSLVFFSTRKDHARSQVCFERSSNVTWPWNRQFDAFRPSACLLHIQSLTEVHQATMFCWTQPLTTIHTSCTCDPGFSDLVIEFNSECLQSLFMGWAVNRRPMGIPGLVNSQFALPKTWPSRKSWFTYESWWCSTVMWQFTRG